MTSFDPAIQMRLIRDLEPAVAVELERHLKIQKEWYPHDYVPWSEGRNFAGPLNGDAWKQKIQSSRQLPKILLFSIYLLKITCLAITLKSRLRWGEMAHGELGSSDGLRKKIVMAL